MMRILRISAPSSNPIWMLFLFRLCFCCCCMASAYWQSPHWSDIYISILSRFNFLWQSGLHSAENYYISGGFFISVLRFNEKSYFSCNVFNLDFLGFIIQFRFHQVRKAEIFMKILISAFSKSSTLLRVVFNII